MKKKLLLSFVFLMIQTLVFSKDYKCTFRYQVALSSGTGKCSKGTDPIVKIDFENNKISFPDFVFSESRTIPAYTVSDVKMNVKKDGSIEIKKDKFEINENGKTITGKKINGKLKGDELKLEVFLKVGKMPFDLKATYYSIK